MTTGFGPSFTQAASSATATQVTATGVQLSTAFLANISSSNQGVILLEGRTDTVNPLVLSVQISGVQVAQTSLQLSLGPRILLLLHGMNSNPGTWDDFVNYPGIFNGFSAVIFNGTLQTTTPPLTANGVRCYRLQFGASDSTSTRTGLIDTIPSVGLAPVSASNTLGYLGNLTRQCGDFETFDQLGQEVNAAVALLRPTAHPNAKIVLVGHSRGGLAARDFLEITGNPVDKAAVVALLTTSSPHSGSPVGQIYGWLDARLRNDPDTSPDFSTNPLYTSNDNADDWGCVDFLASNVTLMVVKKAAIDVRRPVIMDVADRSAAITTLNAAIGRLPTNIRYGEIKNDGVNLGILTQTPQYSPFSTEAGWLIWAGYMSLPAETYILNDGYNGTSTSNTTILHGDGLVPVADQDFVGLAGFPATAYKSTPTITSGVIHTQAPGQYLDINTQLNILEPSWFPSL